MCAVQNLTILKVQGPKSASIFRRDRAMGLQYHVHLLSYHLLEQRDVQGNTYTVFGSDT